MNTTTLKAPFGWVGGKSKLAKDIVALIPHDHKTYVEVFGGGLSVFYAKEKSKLEIVNDINSELVNLHRQIKTHPQTLSIYLNQLLVSREIFEDIKHERMKARNKIEAAAFYLYLLSQSFGSMTTNFAMQAKSGRKPKDLHKSYAQHSDRLKRVTIENKTFQKLIPLYDKKDAFFYVDPPYFSTESYYKNTGDFGINEHKELASALKNIKGRFLLSYNDTELIRNLYSKFNIKNTKDIKYTLGENKNGKYKTVKEIVITNY